MEKAERDLIMRQGVVLPETPRDRRQREALDEDLAAIGAEGRQVVRLLNFRPSREKSVALAVPELARIEDLLSSGVEAMLEAEVALDESDPRVAELLAAR